MTEDDPRLAMIRSNAELVVEEFGKLREGAFGLDRDSVAWVEGYIERLRGRMGNDGPGGLVSVFGSYLGEAIIAAAGGRWVDDEQGGIGIEFQTGDRCFPFGKVEKQFEQGVEGGESILSFYNISVDYVAKGRLGAAGESARDKA